MKFPRLVYKSASEHLGVKSAEEFDAALKAGWFASVPDALAPKVVETEDSKAPTREELETKATELGIKFDGRTTDAKLGKLIEEALSKG